MTSVTFETAAVADAIRKAAAIAPTKAGQAFDKAAGIVMEVYPIEGFVIIRATDTNTFSMEWVTPAGIDGDTVSWRLPSAVVNSYIGKLPASSGRTVTFTQEGSDVHIVSGAAKMKVRLLDISIYPNWTSYDTEGMSNVTDFGARVGSVEWAASRDNQKLGLRFDGESLVATDGFRMAMVPLKIDGLPHGVTLSPDAFKGIIKSQGSVDIKMSEERNLLYIMPDDTTQLQISILGEDYPNVARGQWREHTDHITLKKAQLIEIVDRVSSIIDAERNPVLDIWFGRGQIAVRMAETELGHIGETLDLYQQAQHEKRYQMRMNPKYLLAALNGSPNDDVTISYNQVGMDRPRVEANLYINGGSGYEVWLAPVTPQLLNKEGSDA